MAVGGRWMPDNESHQTDSGGRKKGPQNEKPAWEQRVHSGVLTSTIITVEIKPPLVKLLVI
jgi:hypothetical protein